MSLAVEKRDSMAATDAAGPRRRRRGRWEAPAAVVLSQILIIAVFFALWELGTRTGFVDAFLFGSPSGIAGQFWKVAVNGSIFLDTGVTMMEALIGFAIGTALGAAAGLALWYSPLIARIASPFIAALNSIPKIALAPIIILWFGTGLTSKIALAVSLTAIVALITAYEAAKEADIDLQALLVTLGASKHQVFFMVVVPATLPAIISTFRINLGFALVGAVVGEFISSQNGLGHLIFTASSFYDLNSVWVGLIVLMIIGFILYTLVDALERRLLPWRRSAGGQSFRL
jgi:NitT/TauT family transport system permease protein